MHDGEQLMELRRQCVELLFACPEGRCVDACPFRAVRQRDVVERVMWLKGLSLGQLVQVIEKHRSCVGGHAGAAAGGFLSEVVAPKAKGTDVG